jgi:FkbM family methyltransferase
MKYYSQYDEEDFLLKYFNKKNNGILIDIGAADGKTNSNSRYLIEFCNWSGILIEPHPEYYKSLFDLYKNNNNIKLYNIGIFNIKMHLPFYKFGNVEEGQVSTFSESFKNKVESYHGNKYSESINIECNTITNILQENNLFNIDFVTVDCEGLDMEVLESNNWDIFRPKLICIEHSIDKILLSNFMNSKNYTKIYENIGNSFYETR